MWSVMDMHSTQLTIGVTEFKARCLEILTRLSDHRLRHVVITRRGKPVAEMTPPKGPEGKSDSVVGMLKGKLIIPEGVDLTEPTGSLDDWNASKGILYNE